MSITIDCGEGRHEQCSGTGTQPYLIPQEAGPEFVCACACHAGASRQDDEYQDGRHYKQPETWTLTLNRYQRDNLLWLLQLVGGWPHGDAGDRAVEPFTFANTGDWLGEVAGMLGTQQWEDGDYRIRFDPRRPNMSVDEIRELVDRWRAQWRRQ